ncbi:hypothetical protein [Flavobacterium johnsoniae]|uniref:hypothetical protein n=1 Tax=Flavobacterium johnsoniae TaxID=986 RepID=UPI001160139C|nr:hypothetical protein [Flavobacterium johnsoniae]
MSKAQHRGLDLRTILERYKRAAGIFTCLFLIALNLASLYLVVDLMSYDEMVGYLSGGEIKYSGIRHFIYVLLAILVNILFIFFVTCGWLAGKKAGP